MGFFEENQIDASGVKVFIGLETFFLITAHSGNLIKDNGVSRLDLLQQSLKHGAIYLPSGVCFFDNDRIGVNILDVSNLAVNTLFASGNATSTVDNTHFFHPPLWCSIKQTFISFDTLIIPQFTGKVNDF